ncbi:MAG: polyphosphate kinase 2 family protein, partial [Chlorobia bacterium]|nr:polyphosphate kinase 2 family protein [Fimbriimonadaceae bacterium]
MSNVHKIFGSADLRKIDTRVDGGMTKEQGIAKTLELGKELDELQELLYAAGTHSLLIVLQGRDTAGKDGAMRGLSRFVSIQGVHVASFKAPSPDELAHDYLWRIHKHTPAKGQISILNRSHYEDVLIVRVHNFVPKEVWSKRYDQINEFEELLAENGTIIVKFCLHISLEEQEQRLLAREQEVAKAWKLNAGDWQERTSWEEYTDAYNAALTKCNPGHAPWYVVPADRKWYRDLVVTETLVD